MRRAPCQIKKPFEDPRRRRGSCWEEQKIKKFLRQGTIYGQKIECLCLQLATTSSSGCHTTFLTSCVWAWSTEAHEYSSSSWSTSQIHTDLSLKTKKMGVNKLRVCHEMNVSFETLVHSGVECNRSNDTHASAPGPNVKLNQPHRCTQVNALFYNK